MRKKLSENYNLAICFPEIAKEWHPTKNGKLRPQNFATNSTWKAWWLCEHNHEYQATINTRNSRNNSGCPFCSGQRVGFGNDFASYYPELLKNWHPTKNGNLNPRDFTKGSNQIIWWICSNNHEFKSPIKVMARSYRNEFRGCRRCADLGNHKL